MPKKLEHIGSAVSNLEASEKLFTKVKKLQNFKTLKQFMIVKSQIFCSYIENHLKVRSRIFTFCLHSRLILSSNRVKNNINWGLKNHLFQVSFNTYWKNLALKH